MSVAHQSITTKFVHLDTASLFFSNNHAPELHTYLNIAKGLFQNWLWWSKAFSGGYEMYEFVNLRILMKGGFKTG